MAGGTYPDGFPLNPLEAIEFSYFLTDQEKAEWREWLKTANSDQQLDLVNTLHDIWIENQKQAVPSGFQNQQQPPAQRPQTPPQQAQANTQQPQQQTQRPAPQQAQQRQTPPPQKFTNPPPVPPATPAKQQQKPATPPPAPTPPPKPQQQEPPKEKEPEKKFTFKKVENNEPGHQKEEESKKSIQPPKKDQETPKKAKTESKKPEPKKGDSQKQDDKKDQGENKKSFFNLSKLAEDKSKSILQDVYKDFKNKQQNQDQFIEKLMQTILEFESVQNYFEVIAERMILLNDKLIEQTKQINGLENKFRDEIDDNRMRDDDLQDQINDIKDDVDRLAREIRQSRKEVKEKHSQIDEELGAYTADMYKKDGLVEKMSLIIKRLQRLESISGLTAQSKARQRFSKLDQLKSSKKGVENKPQQQVTQKKPGDKSEAKSIDLRNRV